MNTTFNRLRYTLWAPGYDVFLAVVPFLRRGRRRSIEMAALQPAERVLILAAGTGLDFEFLPHDVDVTATDLTPAMLARAARRATRLGRTIHFDVQDAAELSFPDASFDCVILHLALAVVPDPFAVTRESARVLRPGGRVAIFDKFLPAGARPSALRRAANGITRLLATEINRQLEPLLTHAGLEETVRETIGLRGNFIAVRADKAV